MKAFGEIYAVKWNGGAYVGKAIGSSLRRWGQHLSKLSANTHHCSVLVVVGFVFLIHAQLTPRPVKYSMKELELYTEALDSLRTTNREKDSLITLLRGDLHVSEWNNKAIVAQLDVFTEANP